MKLLEVDIVTKVIEIYPLHQISSLEIGGEHFCYILEDIDRPAGYKVNGWTCLPRTGMVSWYNVGIRHSPGFGREMLSIYNQPDKVTVEAQGKKFEYAMFHGGNNHSHTEGCPLTAYNLIEKESTLEYNGKATRIKERIVQGTAEKDLFEQVAPVIRGGEDVKLFMLGL